MTSPPRWRIRKGPRLWTLYACKYDHYFYWRSFITWQEAIEYVHQPGWKK